MTNIIREQVLIIKYSKMLQRIRIWKCLRKKEDRMIVLSKKLLNHLIPLTKIMLRSHLRLNQNKFWRKVRWYRVEKH